MKKLISLFLACILCLSAFSALAEETVYEPYEAAASELYRLMMIRDYNRMLESTPVRGKYEDWPNGIIIDLDDQCVRVIANEKTLTLHPVNGETDLWVIGGYVCFQAYYTSNDWSLRQRVDGEILRLTDEQKDLLEQGLQTYIDLAPTGTMLKWMVWSYFPDDPYRDLISNIRTARLNATLMENMAVYDFQLLPQLGCCIMTMNDPLAVVIQAEQNMYVFFVAEESDLELVQALAAHKCMLGGCEYEDMLVLRTEWTEKEDGSNSVNVFELSEDEVREMVDEAILSLWQSTW